MFRKLAAKQPTLQLSATLTETAPGNMATAAAAAPPMSQTWDGEPCPVHHQHAQPMPLAALYGMGGGPLGAISMGPSSVPPSIISGATTVRR